MPGPEKRFQSRIVKQLRAIGGVWFENPRSRFGKSGVPDVNGIIGGCAFYLEFKDPKGSYKVTPTQRRTLEKLRDAGAVVGVIDSEEKAEDVLKTAQYMGQEPVEGVEVL